ncbi:MAG: hypothetical protein ABIK67_01925 [candidate division WOR-3 bacterium]
MNLQYCLYIVDKKIINGVRHLIAIPNLFWKCRTPNLRKEVMAKEKLSDNEKKRS